MLDQDLEQPIIILDKTTNIYLHANPFCIWHWRFNPQPSMTAWQVQNTGHRSQVQVTALCILRLVCAISILFIIIYVFFD